MLRLLLLTANMLKRYYLDILAIFILLIVSAYLRLGDADIVEFKRDEANLSLLALEMGQDGVVPLLGIGSSIGFPNAPINVYLLAIPYTITTNPQVATQFVGLLNVIAVWMTYGIARRYTNLWIAFLIGMLFAVSPWSLVFSRKIWAQNMLLPFVIASVYTGVVGFIDGKRWGQWLHLPILAFTGQIHYVAFVLIPASLFLIWQGRSRLTRVFWLSVIPTALVVLPYLIGLYRGDLLSLDAITSALRSGSDQADTGIKITTDALYGAGLLISGAEIHALAGSERFLDYLSTVPNSYPLLNVLSVVVFVSVCWLVFRAITRRDGRTPVDIALVIWLITPVLAFSISWTPYFIHYLIPIFPAVFLIIAFAGHDLWIKLNKTRRRGFMVLSVGTISVIIILQCVLWFALLDFVNNNATSDGFGIPLGYLMTVRDEIIEQVDEGHVIGRFEGQAIVFDSEPTVWNALLYDVDNVRFENRQTQVFPASETLVLSDRCNIIPDRIVFRMRENEGCYSLDQRFPNQLDLSTFTIINQDQPYRFNNGVELIAYRFDEYTSEVCVSIVWQIMQRTDQDYMFALPFFDADGNRLLNADGLSWFGRYWREGDTVIREFCVPSPEAEVRAFTIGMYTYDGVNFFNVDLLDMQNAPAGQSYHVELSVLEP